MPGFGEFLSSATLDPWALGTALVLAVLYGWGVLRQRGNWPWSRTAMFFVLGLGSYLWVSCGFLGSYSGALRWAFAIKLALLLFVVPLLLALGKPLSLLRASIPAGGFRDGLARIGRRPLAFFANAFVAPLLALLLFSAMLTPMAGVARLNWPLDEALTVAIPLLGLLLVLPITEAGARAVNALIVLELLFAFIELLLDAVPGVFLRLSGSVLDGAGTVAGAHPGWFPNPLRDQQLAGDWLWFIAEAADLPLLILMFMRFSKMDKRERADLDELSDEEMEALSAEHLRRFDGSRQAGR
ncbi:cytochrome c oxidase assembly factor CtaG [Psychromicrobium silvestre]|uniref:Cytochrome c oxidase assembly factor CtaG n=1 Tax=Psychromicrobium silvestre TaxID=1645614 RepID=A0A7Y9LSN2_9MICC|nr:cytochrome c oxidase assembly protein [Psychromicrobium silvestre]NYE94870.1 cytochrome c oxidase assembly factor CtaG [Psychromicrobium silvestre]